METPLSFNNDLFDLLNTIKPHQILIIVVLLNSVSKTAANAQLLAELYECSDYFNDSPLATTPVKWRLLYVKCVAYVYLNVGEVLKFVSYDLDFKNINNGCNAAVA
ncbi:hypothetical protein TcWFU_001227 [Taenia crassiceps]|uniref:Uncharacterized protein n=1 Tax=Taenia crassiceps TaxID=6207 RepID=A0ABR4QB54_9CEST